MYEKLSSLNTQINNLAWGMPLVILLIGGGALLLIYSRLLPFTGFVHALKLTLGKYHHPGDADDPGQISHFKALCNALAATVGLGNIAGVAVAITTGGPGAIFWMWVAALLGMNTKFFECSLAVMYRGKDHTGQVQGGPMYVIDKALPHYFKPMAVAFAVFGLIGTTALYTVNQTVGFFHEAYSQEAHHVLAPIIGDRITLGVICAVLVTYVLLGGIKRLAQWTSAIVPVMCLFYVLAALTIIALHLDAVPAAFASIFERAFSIDAGAGGLAGWATAVLVTGVKRAAFSNEAGVGTAPMAHSNAKTTEPISEGLVAMLGPLIDTLIVCTMTALVILVSTTPDDYEGRKGVVLTHYAFTQTFGGWGTHGLAVAVFLFGFSTMVGMANYNAKCWNYLFRGAFGRADKWLFLTWFAATLILGAAAPHDEMINVIDSAYGLMAMPTMITTLILAPRIVHFLRGYTNRHIHPAPESQAEARVTDGVPLIIFGLMVLMGGGLYLTRYSPTTEWKVVVALGCLAVLIGSLTTRKNVLPPR